MITEFGKELRKIRIDHDELLKDMAARLGVKASFLSAVEIGKKNVPENWFNTLVEQYALSLDEEAVLRKKAQNSVNAVKINLYGSGPKQRNMALVLARSFEEMSDETASKILDYMSKDKSEEA